MSANEKFIKCYFITDPHGNISNLPKLASLLKNKIDAASKQEVPLLFFGGDAGGPSHIWSYNNGQQYFKLLESIFRVATAQLTTKPPIYCVLGNHDLSGGDQVAIDRIRNANFVLIATDLIKTNTPFAACQDVIQRPDVNAQIFAITTPSTGEAKSTQLQVMSKSHKLKKLRGFIVNQQSNSKVNHSLWQTQKQKLNIIISHQGFIADKDMLAQLGANVVILGGHSHDVEHHHQQHQKGISFVCNGGMNALGLTTVKLTTNPDGTLKTIAYDYFPLSTHQALIPDLTIQRQINDLNQQMIKQKLINPGDLEPIAVIENLSGLEKPIKGMHYDNKNKLGIQIQARASSTALYNLFCDTAKQIIDQQITKKTLPHIVLYPAGALRATPSAGKLTRLEAKQFMCYKNQLCTLIVSGKDLLGILESGIKRRPESRGGFLQCSANIKYGYHIESLQTSKYQAKTDKPGQRITWITINGASINLEKNYILTTSKRLVDGNDGHQILHQIAKQPCSKLLTHSITEDKIMLLALETYGRNYCSAPNIQPLSDLNAEQRIYPQPSYPKQLKISRMIARDAEPVVQIKDVFTNHTRQLAPPSKLCISNRTLTDMAKEFNLETTHTNNESDESLSLSF